jgi:hypothetical protein
VMTPLVAAWPHVATRLARPASGTDERPNPAAARRLASSVEADMASGQHGEGGHSKWAARWRQPRRADAVVAAAAVTRCPWWRQPQRADVVLQASGAV